MHLHVFGLATTQKYGDALICMVCKGFIFGLATAQKHGDALIVWCAKASFWDLRERAPGRGTLIIKVCVIVIQVFIFFCRSKLRHQGIKAPHNWV
jgi:hypothetical protein